MLVRVGALNAQLEIFKVSKVLLKDGAESTCFYYILKIKTFCEPEKNMICKLLVNPATSAAGEILFCNSKWTEYVASVVNDTSKV